MSSTTPDRSDDPERPAPMPVLRRAVAASAIGNAVEWFDYGIYAYGVDHIAKALFPGSSANAVAFTLLGFALSFVVRPLGGIIWGPLGDRIGRKRVLATTILLMAGSTFLVAFVPSYASIGIWAPVALYALRILQGFSTGGEYGGAATFMAEYAPNRRRGFFGSFLEFGTLSGFSLGALLMLGLIAGLSGSQMDAWGWRLPFLVAGPLGLVGMYLRARMEDTPVFRDLESKEQVEENATGALKEACVSYVPQLLKLFGMVIALNVVNYTLLSYMPTYLQNTIGLGNTSALVVPIVGQLVMMAVLPFVGALSDRTGRKPLWAASLLGLAVLSVPLFKLMGTGFAGAILAFAILGLLYTPQLATISATFPAMFPSHVRFAGLALGYNLATSIFGGTAPLVNDRLIAGTGDQLWPAYYMVIACLVGLVAVVFLVETKGVSIRGTGVPGTEEASGAAAGEAA